MRSTRWTRTVAAAITLLAACSGDPAPDTRTADGTDDTVRCASFDPDCTERLPPDTVELRGILFRPDILTIDTGTSVTFSNFDEVDHTVTAGTPDVPEPDGFDELLETAGVTVEIPFDQPGEYAYFCRIHPSTMQGLVIVE